MDEQKTIDIGRPLDRGYRLTFPLDFAGTLCARDGVHTTPHSPNGQDAYDRKLVCMIVRRKKKKRVVRCYENHGQDCRVREIIVSPTIPQKAGTGGNNLPIVCFSGPQDHCVTRGYMDECSPTLNAAAGMSGNNRPFICHKCFPINSMVIGKDGGNGDRQTFGIGEDGEPCPTLQTSHHHACGIIKCKKSFGIDQQGGKGGANYTEDVAPTICSDSHGTPHGVTIIM